MNRDFTGAVLAGGRSSRMGRDKASIPVGGEPLLERQLRLLLEAGAGERLVSLHPGSPVPTLPIPTPTVRYVTDTHPQAGPLAGLEAVLSTANHPRVLLLAVDLPDLTLDFLTRLTARSGPHHGVIPSRNQQLEPLAAFYPKTCLAIARDQLGRGEFALTRFARRCLDAGLIREWPLASDEHRILTNWNRPDDWMPAGRAVKDL